jgi:hypothetical protein
MALPAGSTKKKDRKALHFHVEADRTFVTYLFRTTVLGNEQLIITGIAVVVVVVNIITVVVITVVTVNYCWLRVCSNSTEMSMICRNNQYEINSTQKHDIYCGSNKRTPMYMSGKGRRNFVMTNGTHGQELFEIHLQIQVYLNDLSFFTSRVRACSHVMILSST